MSGEGNTIRGLRQVGIPKPLEREDEGDGSVGPGLNRAKFGTAAILAASIAFVATACDLDHNGKKPPSLAIGQNQSPDKEDHEAARFLASLSLVTNTDKGMFLISDSNAPQEVEAKTVLNNGDSFTDTVTVGGLRGDVFISRFPGNYPPDGHPGVKELVVSLDGAFPRIFPVAVVEQEAEEAFGKKKAQFPEDK